MFKFYKTRPSSTLHELKMMHTFESRKSTATKLYNQHPDKILVVVERSEKSEAPDIDKRLWFIDKKITVGQFIHNIRRLLKLEPSECIALYINNSYIPKTKATFGELEDHKEKDGILYTTYS